jgi:hypothetical protein
MFPQKIIIYQLRINKMKLKAYVPQQNVDEVKWLVIESDEEDTKGYFIYYYLSDGNAYDTWHKTIEDAFAAAYSQYGIGKGNWEVLNDE